ncbi:hypothetical protein JNUCC1_02263 [Lentibacillus sp. JNUCC-1]|uniref:BREX-1 system phosphatase PglZ type A n=1 Tax=Lentibacillus sp. JNUCC-1 TaxID=2654513 RepID=UPI0012E78D69|nr:BREX-1 system phosphatase PglZ type A [Lentibacillus sp. JNUCC-1]MUV38425.1 hypothetical protein [Lentibacillus sp. JNUCC-1]
MNLSETQRVLADFFQKELTHNKKRHLVFWYDESGEFAEDIEQIDIPGVRKWIIRKDNLFATKYELEKRDPDSHFLLYANMPKPIPREDWLYDQFCMGQEFATDKITVIMRELGLTDDALRETFKTFQSFFNNKERLRAFRKYDVHDWTEEAIELTVLAALTKSKTNTIDDIIKALMHEHSEDRTQLWEVMDKYAGSDVFWQLVEKYYGYMYPDKSLESLALSFIMTYMAEAAEMIEVPQTWKPFISGRTANVVVFMDQWMNHREDRHVYDKVAGQLERHIDMEALLAQWDVRERLAFDAFRIFDRTTIDYVVHQLISGMTYFKAYADMLEKRRHSHWYSEFEQEYGALSGAIELLQLVHEELAYIPEMTGFDLFTTYEKNYYRLDTAYRKFYVHYDRVKDKDDLLGLRDYVEKVYTNQFMNELAIKWAHALEATEKEGWPIPGISQQGDFYRDWVMPYQHNNERVFVIISDALRFEVAKEVMNALNHERKASTELKAMQGVLPSFTALGMAALLPHNTLALTEDGKVLADGNSTVGLKNREMLLQTRTPEAMAISFDEVVEMNRGMMREAFQGKKMIYIYHNVIDATGDNASTEQDVFQAAETAVDDITQLVNQLVVNLSVSNVLITADHGFIYQRDNIAESQKTPRYKGESLLLKRRFMLTDGPINVEETLSYEMNQTNGGKPLFITVPKGINRFPIQGAGANFVHGGAMLQEIVVPVIKFKNDRSRSDENAVKQVIVRLTTPTRKITHEVTYLTFLQTERVDDKRRPLRLNAYFVDEAGMRVSNENVIIADRTANHPAERTFREKFVFKRMNYDKRKTYTLVLEDEEDKAGAAYERYSFTIDIIG